jgi:glycosyltransferase involved in cell wall biosynthesis
MKLLISHPNGNENVRQLLKCLYEFNILGCYATSIATFPDNIYGRLSNIKLFADFNRRRYFNELQNLTKTYPSKELGRLLSSKLAIKYLVQHETGIFSIDKVCHFIDFKASLLLRQNDFKAVYAYEDAALDTFTAAKLKNIRCLYDLPIGYWRAARELLKDEKLKQPQWSNTLTGFKDSEKKLLRKDRELSLASHIFVASSFTKQTLSYYDDVLAPISVIPYGFPEVSDKKVYDNQGLRKLKLLFVGSLSQRKGIANVFEAANILKDHVELTVIGRKVVDDCTILNENLKKHKWIPSLPHSQILEQMICHDILIFPSLFEGFGLVITESMSQGTPVITTNRTAGTDFIKHGENGWIVEAGETNSLIKTLEEILNNIDSLIDISMAALSTARMRPWNRYGGEMAEAIVNILKS